MDQDIKQVFKYIQENDRQLSANCVYFIKSLRKYYDKNKKLSDRQLKSLFEIKENIQL